MDTQTQIDRLIELAIIQRSELKQLVEQLPQLREHLNAEVEKVFDETEPQLRAELEEWTTKQTADKTAALGVALEAKIADLAKSLEVSTQARYNAIIAERAENASLAAQAEAKIAEHAASLPSAVKDIVSAELARFPRAGEIDQLRKEFAEPRGLNPRGKWQAGESYNKLDLVTINGDSYTSNTNGNRTRPSRSSADWTLVAARGTGGGGGPTSLSELTTVPSDGDVLIGSGTSWVTSNLTAGAGISITVGPGAITISATDGDITLDDGTAASPSLHFTNDPDTGIYRPTANTLGISTSGVQRMYVDENGITTVGAGATFDGSVHAANGNANNPSLSFTSDQDTGFFRHQPNEIGIALGGTQYATLTSTTFSITPVVTMASSLRVNGTTDSSSKDTGAIVTEGGLGVEKSATFGGNLTVNGTGTIANELTVYNSVGIGIGNITEVATNGVATLYANYNGYQQSNTQFRNFAVYDGKRAEIATFTGSTKAVNFAGNLTVSGRTYITGARSDNSNLSLNLSATIPGISINCTSAGASRNFAITNNYSGAGLLEILGSSAALSLPNTPLLAVTASGNLLLGTTTDSGNGKLQLATHTTSAGGIGFGTDTQLFTTGSGLVSLTSSTTWPTLKISDTGTGTYTTGVLAFGDGNSSARNVGIWRGASNSIVATGNVLNLGGYAGITFTTGGAQIGSQTIALTLDSSQNATFVGTVTGSGGFVGTDNASNNAYLFLARSDVSFSIANETSLRIYSKAGRTNNAASGGVKLLEIANTSGNATFTGAIAIGNTVNTVSPTSPNRTITMVIGGTTYYIHAKTTND